MLMPSILSHFTLEDFKIKTLLCGSWNNMVNIKVIAKLRGTGEFQIEYDSTDYTAFKNTGDSYKSPQNDKGWTVQKRNCI
jgi:hypothetical protein